MMRKNNQGYTLIELLVANGLGVLMIAGIVQIFNSNSQSIRFVDASSRVQEGGRIGVDMIAKDVRLADYWGCAPDPSDIVNHLDPNDSDYDANIHNPTATVGLASQNDVSTVITIGSVTVTQGTDTITFRGSEALNGVRVVVPYMPTVAANIQITNGADIPLGTPVLISNCTGGDFFSNTNGNTLQNGNLVHNTGQINATGAVDNATQQLSQTYKGDAVISTVYATTYFVGTGSNGGNSLYRFEGTGNADELIPNVSNLQFEFGEDSNSDGSVDRFADAGSVNLDNAIAVRITLTLESPQNNIVAGGPLSRAYSTTTTIRNRSL